MSASVTLEVLHEREKRSDHLLDVLVWLVGDDSFLPNYGRIPFRETVLICFNLFVSKLDSKAKMWVFKNEELRQPWLFAPSLSLTAPGWSDGLMRVEVHRIGLLTNMDHHGS